MHAAVVAHSLATAAHIQLHPLLIPTTCFPCPPPLFTLPGFLELNVQRSSYHASVSQHLLLSYNKSLAAILRGQHEGKSIRWGCRCRWGCGCGGGAGLDGEPIHTWHG